MSQKKPPPPPPKPPAPARAIPLTESEREEVRAAETRVLRARAEVGDVELEIMRLEQIKREKAGAVLRLHQENVALATTLVRAHGLDPDKERWNLNLQSLQLERLG